MNRRFIVLLLVCLASISFGTDVHAKGGKGGGRRGGGNGHSHLSRGGNSRGAISPQRHSSRQREKGEKEHASQPHGSHLSREDRHTTTPSPASTSRRDPAARSGEFRDQDESVPETTDRLTGRENALYRQLRNEERKLARRMQAVEQLRNLGQLQGDERLLDAADRLEEDALGHYTKRLQKIAEFQDRFGLPTPELLTVPMFVVP